jgi:predicted kinase
MIYTRPSSESFTQPLLLYKIGVRGAEPGNSCRVLARELKTNYFSTHDIRMTTLRERALRQEPSKKIRPHDTVRHFANHIAPVLLTGSDVVLDMKFNSPKNRQSLLERTRHTGAIAVGLHMVTPVNAIVERVAQYADNSNRRLKVGDSKNLSPDVYVSMMLSNLVRPQPDEELGIVIDVDGSGNTNQFLGNVMMGLQTHGLVKQA